jgi:anti-sigma B factor antagonist
VVDPVPKSSSPLSITSARTDEYVVLTLAGTLDVDTATEFEQAVVAQLRSGELTVLDAADLRLCDSTGLGAIVRAHRRAVAVGGRIALRAPRPYVADLLAMTGVDKVVEVRPA